MQENSGASKMCESRKAAGRAVPKITEGWVGGRAAQVGSDQSQQTFNIRCPAAAQVGLCCRTPPGPGIWIGKNGVASLGVLPSGALPAVVPCQRAGPTPTYVL